LYEFEHSDNPWIFLNGQRQYGSNIYLVAQLRIKPPIGMRVVGDQGFGRRKAERGEADARLQTGSNVWSGAYRRLATGDIVSADHNGSSSCRRFLHCQLQNGLKLRFRICRRGKACHTQLLPGRALDGL
jgi:hypothetical protein